MGTIESRTAFVERVNGTIGAAEAFERHLIQRGACLSHWILWGFAGDADCVECNAALVARELRR